MEGGSKEGFCTLPRQEDGVAEGIRVQGIAAQAPYQRSRLGGGTAGSFESVGE